MKTSERQWRIKRFWDDSWEGFRETWKYPYNGEENRYATRDEAEAAARRHIEGEVFWSDPPDCERNDISSAVAHYKVCRVDGSDVYSASMVVHMDPRDIEGHPHMYEHDCEHDWREVTKMRGRVAHKRATCATCGLNRHMVLYPESTLLSARSSKVNYVEYRLGWWKLASVEGISASDLRSRAPRLVVRNKGTDCEDFLNEVEDFVESNCPPGTKFVCVNNAGARIQKCSQNGKETGT